MHARPRVDRIVGGALVALVAAAAAFAIVHAARAVAFPFPLDYGEGPLLDQARHLARGQNPWRVPLDDYPFTVANYPPLLPALLVPMANAGALAYPLGRVLAISAAMVCAWHVFDVVRAHGGERLHAAAAAALFVASPYVVFWSMLVRVDFVALALSLGAVRLVARRPDGKWTPVAAGALVALAALTRQSHLLAAPLAIAGTLRARRGFAAAAFLATVAGGVAAAVVALQLATGGGFLFHVVTANANRVSSSLLGDFAADLGVTSAAMLVVAAAQALRRDPAARLVSFYLLGGALSALAIAKVGSHVNYFLELIAAASIACGVALGRARSQLRIVVAAQIAASIAIAALRPLHMEEKVAERADFERLRAIVAAQEGPVLADETMGLLPMVGKDIVLQPFELTQLARQGLWDDGRVVADLRAARFGLVLVNDGPATPAFWVRERWTPRMRDALREAYVPTGALAGATLYRPRAREP